MRTVLRGKAAILAHVASSGRLPRSFTDLAWSNLAAQSAEQISLAAAPMIAVLMLGAGPGETDFIAAAQTLPFLLLSIPTGILADRMSRRALMIAAEALRAVSLLALIVLAMTGGLTMLPALARLPRAVWDHPASP